MENRFSGISINNINLLILYYVFTAFLLDADKSSLIMFIKIL